MEDTCFVARHPTRLTAECEEQEDLLYSVLIRNLLCDAQVQCEVGFSVPQLPVIQPAVASLGLFERL